jgi:RNA-directed DNA polymerase
MGNSDSIDISLSSLYRSWYAFRRGKRASSEVIAYEYSLEQNLMHLHTSLVTGKYNHGSYNYFEVNDSKRRDIAVAAVQDRIIHRLLYDYLVPQWDKAFIFDAWSCRKSKGQHLAIKRAANFMRRYQNGWIWRADIHKFFDSVDQTVLFELISRRTRCPTAQWLILQVLNSYYKNQPGKGMPIGNLTSQIFANIYLNELDRYMVHALKPNAYLRYGDDWLCFSDDLEKLKVIHSKATRFVNDVIRLSLSPKLNKLSPVYNGTTYLGMDLWPTGKRITKGTSGRVKDKITLENYASYEALIEQFSSKRAIKRFYWQTIDLD